MNARMTQCRYSDMFCFCSCSRLVVDFYGKTGGFKVVQDKLSGKLYLQRFTGIELSQPLHILFDVLPPTHCSMDNSCGSDDVGVPVYVTPDISKVHLWAFFAQ